MRRSAAAALGVVAGAIAGAAFFRRSASRREHVDLYYADGSMLSLEEGAPEAQQLLPLAREILRRARPA